MGIVGGFKSLFAETKRLSSSCPLRMYHGYIQPEAQFCGLRVILWMQPGKKFTVLLATLRQLNVRYLLTIGGDGTAYMARWIEKASRGKFSVVHVPKTIDNDLISPATDRLLVTIQRAIGVSRS